MKRNRLTVEILLMTIVLSALSAFAASDFHVPRVRMPLVAQAPVIDGKINADEWAGAIRVERFCGVRDPMLTGGEAAFYIACDGVKVYLAVDSETAPGNQLQARVEPAPEDGDARVWLDDSVELVFDPLRTAPEERRRLYHAILNARGAVYDQRHAVKGGGEAWRGHWESASTIENDRWHFEVALPLADLGMTAADLAQPFGVRVCRNWQRAQGHKQSEWSAVGGAFLSTETMPEIVWDAAAPVVQTLQLRDPDGTSPHLKVAIRNPHAQPLTVQATLSIRPKSSNTAERREAVTVPAGETKVVELACGMAHGDQAYTMIEIASPDGQTIYFQRDFQWRMDRPEPFFTTGADDAKRVALDLAYFPSHQKLKVRLDISGLQEKAAVTGAALTLRARGTTAALAAMAAPALVNHKAEFEWAIPALSEGEYELVASLEGVKLEPVVAPFVRHVFPWEGNTIGMSDILIPPFTPIEVKGNQVSTVLRTHTIGGAGLWDQVVSLGEPLLKAPMRLEAKVGGQVHAATGPGLASTEQKPTRAVAAGQWTAGPVTGSLQTDWDFDGSMKWTLVLPPSAAPVEALTLTIPLDNARFPLMHACTDGIRFNYAGVVPAGEGPVWKSSQAARNSIIGSYVPYLWIGAEERGLCVYGENDAGWVTSPEVPCQELIRRGETLELVLHLIAKPTVIDTERTIVMAFQATPVKPMPEDWRRWVFGAWRGASIPELSRYFAFLGSCWYWGTETPCLDWYPRGQDFTYFRKLAETRRTGEVDKAYIEEWLKGFEPIFAAAKTPEKRQETEKIYRNHTNAAFHTMKGKPANVNIYTNGRGVRFDTPEGQTFLDEWHRDAYSTRVWPHMGGVAYDLDPVASFRDYAIWYFKEMAGILVDSFYWDDLFLQANFDTVGTPAYTQPSGFVQPSVGLWNMREFVRRTAVMQLEMGKPAQNIVHMTNTAIVPVLAFAQMNYTWEDKAGAADFQDRFSRDYIRAESIGLQQGNVPFALWLVKTDSKEQADWVERTGTGCMLVHEIKTSGGGEIYWATCRMLFEYGYGQPEVRVSQYWKADHPATLKGSDAVSLVVSKPGSALVLVCDYGDGGDLTLSLDRQALGLTGTLTATDRETGETLTVNEAGQVTFPLKKHDFRLILIQAAQP